MNSFIQVYRRKRKMQTSFLKEIKELKLLNRDKEFTIFRERYIELIFAVLTAAGVYFILGWQLLDYLTGRQHLTLLFFLRVVVAGLFLLNFSVYLFAWKKFSIRFFIFFGFYLVSSLAPYISYYTGGFESPYWLDLLFILIVWFMLIPFSYRTLAVHGLVFIFIYSATLFILVPHHLNWMKILEHIFIFSSMYVIGIIVAVFNNIFSATVYRSEKKIRHSEERFRMFTQNSLDVVWTMEMKNRTFTYVSPSVYNLRGYRPEEIIGKPIVESLTPESRLQVERMLEHAIEEFNNGKRENVMIGEMEQYTVTGDTVWIEVIASFITDTKGNIVEIMGDSRNITERKRAEKELLTIQEKLREESELLQQENIRIQYESLKNQVNPHFLFNSLNVLTSLIKLNPDLAEKFAVQMAKVYRYVLEHREEDMVSLRSEIDFIQSYTFLLQIRFVDKVKVNIGIPEFRMNLYVPPLAAQILIENAVKHNTFSKKQPLVIDIFVDDDRYLNVVNTLQKRDAHLASTGVGLANIASRVAHLTERPTFFGEEHDKFVARIPLLENNTQES